MSAYAWKIGSRIKTSAEVAGKVCSELEEQGMLTAKNLVDISRAEDAPLHNEFEWDDAIAAENYREDQARHIIRCLIIQPDVVEQPVRAFFKIDDSSNRYDDVEKIFVNVDSRQLLLHKALKEFMSFKLKYNSLAELSGLFKEFDKIKDIA